MELDIEHPALYSIGGRIIFERVDEYETIRTTRTLGLLTAIVRVDSVRIIFK